MLEPMHFMPGANGAEEQLATPQTLGTSKRQFEEKKCFSVFCLAILISTLRDNNAF